MVHTGHGTHRNSALPSSCTAAASQEGRGMDLAHGSGTDFPDGSDSPFLSHSPWHCHTYLTALNPPLSLYRRIRNPSTIICLGQNNFLRGAIFHSSSSYCCLTGNHLMLFCSKMSPVCGAAVPISLPSSHTLLFYLTLKWQFSRHYRILYFYFLFKANNKHFYLFFYLLNMGILSGNSKKKFQGRPPWFELISIKTARKTKVITRYRDKRFFFKYSAYYSLKASAFMHMWDLLPFRNGKGYVL